MGDFGCHFEVNLSLPLSDQQLRNILHELDFVGTYTAEEREKVSNFFLIMADQPDSTEAISRLYAALLQKVEEGFQVETIPSEFLVLLQARSFALLAINVIFVKASYNRILSAQHSGTLTDTLMSLLRASPDLLPQLLSNLYQLDVVVGRSFLAFSEEQNDHRPTFPRYCAEEIFKVMCEVHSQHPMITASVLKAMFLFYMDTGCSPAAQGALTFPSALRLILEIPPSHSPSRGSAKFSRTMHAVCVEAISELALLQSFSSPWDPTLLVAAVSNTLGPRTMCTLTAVYESMLFSQFPAKARLAALSVVTKALSAHTHTKHSLAGVTQHVDPSSKNMQSRALMILLDVAMLDSAASIRAEALRALLTVQAPSPLPTASTSEESGGPEDDSKQHNQFVPSPPSSLVLQLGGKDLLRVAVFKCRDKSAEVARLAFQLLQLVLEGTVFSYPCEQQIKEGETLSPQEYLVVTSQLLQIFPPLSCTQEQHEFVLRLVQSCITRCQESLSLEQIYQQLHLADLNVLDTLGVICYCNTAC